MQVRGRRFLCHGDRELSSPLGKSTPPLSIWLARSSSAHRCRGKDFSPRNTRSRRWSWPSLSPIAVLAKAPTQWIVPCNKFCVTGSASAQIPIMRTVARPPAPTMRRMARPVVQDSCAMAPECAVKMAVKTVLSIAAAPVSILIRATRSVVPQPAPMTQQMVKSAQTALCAMVQVPASLPAKADC